MLNLTATSLFDGTLATFLVVSKISTKVTKDSLNLLTTNER